LPPAGRRLVLAQIAAKEDEADDYLFPMGAHVASSLNGLLKATCAKVKVTRFSTHGLRRMVVMRMLEAGVDAKTVSKLTGHSLKTLLAHYVRPTQEHLRKAVARAGLGSFDGEGEILEFPGVQVQGSSG
jgi:integrase